MAGEMPAALHPLYRSTCCVLCPAVNELHKSSVREQAVDRCAEFQNKPVIKLILWILSSKRTIIRSGWIVMVLCSRGRKDCYLLGVCRLPGMSGVIKPQCGTNPVKHRDTTKILCKLVQPVAAEMKCKRACMNHIIGTPVTSP
ncbi:uncharacterized protein CIMG_10974 [Coccidioides immitis RS]|uniref:Uncharacterized protein n=1 Tax=Coccidioides immitis (strain RS) TaxID=246410 RepID=A0A0D8JSN7_COCIM|nr:uncharacterized protein CIMG_10974 [Coccidioides immitis RS]KJF59996.1 hypothetical protein CIMG_10974 [Coccidioides immitis RS]